MPTSVAQMGDVCAEYALVGGGPLAPGRRCRGGVPPEPAVPQLAAQLPRPPGEVLAGVGVSRLVHAAVVVGVELAVAGQAEPARGHRSRYRPLVDGRPLRAVLVDLDDVA